MPALARVTLGALVAYTAVAMALPYTFDNAVQLSVGPVHIYLFDLLLLAATALLGYEALQRSGRRMPASGRTVVFIVLGYCAYQMAVIFPVSVIFYGLDPVSVVRQLEWRVSLVLIPFVYLVALKYVSPRRLVQLVNVAAVLLAFYVMYKYATVGPVYDAGTTRLRELWGGAQLLFGFLVLTSLFLSRPRVASFAAALLGLVGIALTNQRSGYLALIVVGVPLFFLLRRASARTVVVGFFAVAAVALLVAFTPTIRASAVYSLRTMLNPNADQTASDRVDRAKLGWDYFVANPLGDYTWSQRNYLVILADPFEPHNFVIQILDEQGIVGFALFAAMIVTTLRVAWRHRAADRVSLVMLACFAYYLVFCLFNTLIINQWNILLLVVPIAVILDRDAALTVPSTEPVFVQAALQPE